MVWGSRKCLENQMQNHMEIGAVNGFFRHLVYHIHHILGFGPRDSGCHILDWESSRGWWTLNPEKSYLGTSAIPGGWSCMGSPTIRARFPP